MRERLVAAFVGLTVVVVALYGIPRAYYLADLVRTQEQNRVDRTSMLIVVVLKERAVHGAKITPAWLDKLAENDERITVRNADGETIASNDETTTDSGDVTVTRGLVGGGTVTVTRDADAVDAEVAQALLPLVLLGIGLIVGAGGVGFLIARRLARPFQELAAAAQGFGAGQLHPVLPTYRVPEAKAIAEALESSGERLDALLQHERDVAVHASHELRTPVTALRLELEDLALWPETPPSVAAELNRCTSELDRLGTAISDLLTRAKERLTVGEIDLDLNALVADTISRLGDDALTVIHQPSGGSIATRLNPEPVNRILEFLVDEAVRYDANRVNVATQDLGTHHEVVLEADVPLEPVREGAAWTDANELAVSIGGQLTRRGDRALVLRLPKRALSSE